MGISELQTFLYVLASRFAHPPDRSHRCPRLRQGSRGFYVRAEHASLPPHASDMLAVRIQVIDGERTFTPPDSQPYRLLRWDRTQARRLLGGGLPRPPFRLRDGISFPPWLRFPRPPYNPGRPDCRVGRWR